MEINSDLQT